MKGSTLANNDRLDLGHNSVHEMIHLLVLRKDVSETLRGLIQLEAEHEFGFRRTLTDVPHGAYHFAKRAWDILGGE